MEVFESRKFLPPPTLTHKSEVVGGTKGKQCYNRLQPESKF